MSFVSGRKSSPVKWEIITGDPERHLVGKSPNTQVDRRSLDLFKYKYLKN
ncbi:hypothetical protein CYANOKiyG1_73990 [Okeania sp. KiyG1]|nr:hypothetical protein CYANOKiyG1_73990 [Okeania sp. KiyG1]